jgi:hypothetical protein
MAVVRYLEKKVLLVCQETSAGRKVSHFYRLDSRD